MKAVTLILTVSLISNLAQAQAKMYLVEPMKCSGKLVSKNPGMHPSYKNKTYQYEFNSIKSTRGDGTLANALEVQTSMTSTYYLSPLFIQRNGVIEKDTGSYDEKLKLQVVSSKMNPDGSRLDQLVGTLSAQGTVVGDTLYKLNCTARVVKNVKRVDDFTSGR